MAKSMNATQRSHLIMRLRDQLAEWRNASHIALTERERGLKVYAEFDSVWSVEAILDMFKAGEIALQPGSSKFKFVKVADLDTWTEIAMRKEYINSQYALATKELEKIIDDLIFKDVGEVSSIMSSFTALLQ